MSSTHQLKQELEAERLELERLGSDLIAIEDAYKRTRKSTGDGVFAARKAVELCRLRIAGIERDIEEAGRPKVVSISDSRPNLEKQRAQVQQRLDYRRRVRKEAQDRILAGHDRAYVEQFGRVLLDNVGHTLAAAVKEDANDVHVLEHIDEQLAELNRREERTPPSAA